jgi:hypothetical protein
LRLRAITTATAAALATAAVALLPAAPASAASARVPIGDHPPYVGAVCSGGEEILFSVDSGYAVTRATESGVAVNMTYRLSYTLLSSGEVVGARGARRIVLDFAAGTITESGNYRSLQLPGEGWVMKGAGRKVWDMTAPESAPPVWEAGPTLSVEDEVSLACRIFGLTA